MTFLVLEIVSFILIVKYNQEQSRIFSHSISQFTGQIDRHSRELGQFFSLRAEIDSLAAENARLKTVIGLTRFDPPVTADSIKRLGDNLLFLYREARVIKNTYSLSNNYVTIDKGSNDGIAPRMGVIGDRGIIGIVRNVSPNYALLMSVLHQQFRVSASLKKSGYFGSLAWQGGNTGNFLMEDIPRSAQPVRGDTVVTNGYSTHFPPDIVIGIVDTAYSEVGSSFFSALVRMTQDPGNVKTVYIVEKLGKDEQLQLENSVYD